jgi:NodT family efflux transporter outer membrane factor (OMF) lipoprotein
VWNGGCTVGPNYEPPAVRAPEAFSEEIGPSTQPSVAPEEFSPALAQWWEVFEDDTLDELVARAIEQNLELRVAASRIIEARAILGVNRSLLLPALDGTGGYNFTRSSQNTGRNGSGSGFNFDPDQELYSAGFVASWEIDVFGGIRRSIEAAEADFDATVEDRRDILVSLLSDVARNYIVLRGAQLQLDILQRNLQTQEQTLELTRSRFRAGLTSDLDVARAETQAMSTRSQIPPVEDQIRQLIRRLSVLLGSTPETLYAELSPVQPIPHPRQEIGTGLPAELLRRRPDVRRAERNLASATAQIGVATADLFPRFSLTGDFGWASEKAKNLFDEKSIGWSIGPSVRWQLLNFGRVTGNIEAARARADQAIDRYEQTVLRSLEETENTIGSYRREQQRRASLEAAVQSSQRAVTLADQLYRQGLTAFQDVLDAQRVLLNAESQLAISDQTVSTNLVAMYRALGGGWNPQQPPPETGPVIRLP